MEDLANMTNEMSSTIAKEQQLRNQIEELRNQRIQIVKQAMEAFGITIGDLQGRKGVKAPVKYVNPYDSSMTWSGRGRVPTWLSALSNDMGEPIEYFRIAETTTE